MTTLTRGAAPEAPEPPPPPGPSTAEKGWEDGGSEREDSRWAQWWASWRVAIRMGRRDVRRHRGRSALIATMVALPMIVVIGGAVVLASQQIDDDEMAPFVLGHAGAAIRVDGTQQINQFQVVTNDVMSVPPPPGPQATPVPGWGAGREADAVAQLVGSPTARVTTSTVRASLGNSSLAVGVLGLDVTKAPYLSGRATLISGRWPTSNREVAVSRTGIQHGLPTSGTVTLRVRGAEVPFTVVGVGDGYQWAGYGAPVPADVVSLPDATGVVPDGQTSGGTGLGMSGVQYLVDRSTPLSDNEIRKINTYGLNVFQAGLPANYGVSNNGAEFAGGTALAAIGLFLLTSLLAGPAFAVSAARQRRTLALGASNGATPRQLRRTVLGQALVLGVLAAVGGVGIGIGAGWGVSTWLNAHRPDSFYGSFDLPLLPVAIVLVSAVLSSVIAALLPSRGLGRLDIVGVLRGQDVSPALHRGLPVLGVALVGTGSALLVWGFVLSRGSTQVVATILLTAGATGLVVGALCVIPALLAVTGRLTRNLPVTIRMATRDAARQRGRATPTVAAVMIGTAILTTLLVALGSDARFRELGYQPSMPMGTGSVQYDPGGISAGGDPVAQIREAVAGVSPDLVVTETRKVDSDRMAMAAAENGTPMSRVPRLAALRGGCTTKDVLANNSAAPDPSGRCRSLDSSPGSFHNGVLTGPADYLARSLHLTADQQSQLASGSMMVVDGPGRPPTVTAVGGGSTVSDSGDAAVDVVGGVVSLSLFETEPGTGAVVGEPQIQRVPAVVIPRSRFDAAFPGRQYGAVVTPETAARLGWPTVTEGIYLVDPRGPIDVTTEARVQAALDSEKVGANLYLERGYTPDASTTQISMGATGIVALIILFATLIATALSQAEGQNMMSTLAAVGATRTTRRRLAAAQAGSLALVGAALGTLLGLVPGTIAAWSETGRAYENEPTVGPVVIIPWLQLLPTLIVVPLLAAALAWVSIRRSPTVTRRLT